MSSQDHLNGARTHESIDSGDSTGSRYLSSHSSSQNDFVLTLISIQGYGQQLSSRAMVLSQAFSTHIIARVRPVPGLLSSPAFSIDVTMLNDTGSNTLTVFDTDIAALAIRLTYMGYGADVPIMTAGGTVTRRQISVEIQLLDSQGNAVSDWILEEGIITPSASGVTRLSGDGIRQSLYFATAPGKSTFKTKSAARKPTKEVKPKQQTTKGVKRNPDPEPSSSSSGSESDDSVEDESDSSIEEGPSTTERDSTALKIIPAQEYRAPEGFKLLTTTARRSPDVSKVFSNLRGKQLWHITAPASVPMNSLRELAFDAVATGGSILTHNGANYKLREDQIGVEKNKALLLPDKHSNTYHRHRLNIAQTFHLEQIVDLANGATHSEQSVPISDLTKPKREQPKGLKMRYKPFGSTDDQPETFGSSSEEPEAEDVSFRMPQSLAQDREGKKRRKSSMEIGSDKEQGERRKKHKRIHSNSADGGAHAHSKNGEVSPVRKSRITKDVGISRDGTDEQHRERARKEERKRKKQALAS
ncbi:hypothetical protein ACJ72_06359 [Emergomyces africanus]|uniref:Uncharacterized protein n=1 Tax=Emergomyces africanus TaxID=1955775 RepID=A0A1B7NRA0_9EURO|nr:hypothetical protein ACJ72_06359 [Emergomyces africanus]